MSIPLPLVAVLAIAGYLLWKILRAYVVRSPLDNLPGPPPKSLLTGNLEQLMERHSRENLERLNETYGPTYAMTSVLGAKMLQTYDPKAMYHILIKEADFWPKRTTASDDFQMVIGPGILSTEGQTHRRQRKMLNPVFSAAHLRNMTHIFYNIAHKVQKAIADRVGTEAQEIDINGWMGRTTLEMLGQAGLGYSFDNFVNDSSDPYGESLKMFFPVMSEKNFIWSTAVMMLSQFFSDSVLLRLSRVVPLASVHRLLDIGDTMRRRSQEIIDEKKAALNSGDDELLQRIGEGKDIMSILLKANTTASDAEKLTDDELIAQMSTFILAGMDTTSNALSRILYLLAKHPSAQDRLREEIQEARGNSDVDLAYDDLVKLPYLDAVCRETMRLFAPVLLTGRSAAKDMSLPLSIPVRGRDGSMITEVPITRGTNVLVHLQASNFNKALWGEDTAEWRPERWLSQLPKELEEARIPGVYSNLMSFSGGGHACIGFKFSQVEMKVVLSVLLPAFKFELTEKPVSWFSSAVSYPTMGEESTKPEMLLKVQAL